MFFFRWWKKKKNTNLRDLTNVSDKKDALHLSCTCCWLSGNWCIGLVTQKITVRHYFLKIRSDSKFVTNIMYLIKSNLKLNWLANRDSWLVPRVSRPTIHYLVCVRHSVARFICKAGPALLIRICINIVFVLNTSYLVFEPYLSYLTVGNTY